MYSTFSVVIFKKVGEGEMGYLLTLVAVIIAGVIYCWQRISEKEASGGLMERALEIFMSLAYGAILTFLIATIFNILNTPTLAEQRFENLQILVKPIQNDIYKFKLPTGEQPAEITVFTQDGKEKHYFIKLPNKNNPLEKEIQQKRSSRRLLL